MGQTDLMNGQAGGLFLGLDPIAEGRDDAEAFRSAPGGVSEHARIGWESAWIDLGGEG
jgi:hypothetical protein